MTVQKWMARARYLRWLDAALAWLGVALALEAAAGRMTAGAVTLAGAGLVALLAALTPLRVRWRPISGAVGVLVSRALRPGDRAWYVRAARASSSHA